jgi:peptide chain release factor 2
MENLEKELGVFRKEVHNALQSFGYEKKLEARKSLVEASERAGFWDDSSEAQKHMQQLATLNSSLEPWSALDRQTEELNELVKLGDDSLRQELGENLKRAQNLFNKLKADLRFNGTYDDHGAILSIYSGAGGTDAQDWTQMLARMYFRWAEQQKLKIGVLEESPGEEAGLKSIGYEIDGPNVYGKLRGEHGVHRLVRLSPFNANNLRQTSFAKVEVLPKIIAKTEVPLDEADLKIDVYRAGGHGGQSVNTTDSAVRITHLPTGIVVSIQNERSQLQNKETAMTILRSKLAQLQVEQHKERLSELKGPNQSAEWGNQIRSYVLHPYKQVKDLRTRYETSDPDAVLDGDLDGLINAYLEHALGKPA